MSGGMICKKSGYSGTSDQCKRLLDNKAICGVIESHRKDIQVLSGYSRARMVRELDDIKNRSLSAGQVGQALQSLKQISDILHFADKTTTTKQISLNLSFEELLARSRAIDITPIDDVQSQDSTTSTFLPPADPDTELDLVENR